MRKARSPVRVVLEYIKAPIQRIVTTFIVLTLIALPGLLVYNSQPGQYSYSSTKINYSVPLVPQDHYRPWDEGFQFNVLMDVHRHPNGIDPELLLQWHIAAGYNAVVMTEHNTIQSSIEVQKVAREKYNDQIKVIVGQEWTNCAMHMGMIGIKEKVDVPKNPSPDQIKAAIKNVHDQGGLVVVNHIPWSTWVGLNQPNSDDLIDWGVDFFDITTAERLDLQTIYYARSRGVRIVAGTDAHGLDYANEWTLFYVDPTNFTEDSILDTLKLKTTNTSFIFDETGFQPQIISETKKSSKYIFAYPWIVIGQFFHSFYDKIKGQYSFVNGYCGIGEIYVIKTPEIVASLGWLIIGWLILEGGWGLLKLAFYKIMNKLRPDRNRGRLLDDAGMAMDDIWDR